MASNGGDYIQVSPERLREMANLFQSASIDISELLDKLGQTGGQLIDDMGSGLKKSPNALSQVLGYWRVVMNGKTDFFQEVAQKLNSLAEEFQDIDQKAIPQV